MEYLTKQKKLHDASVACRMSWASGRSTTRLEDNAYALLGIFGVNMSLRYGEGTKAFTRLQELIMQRSDDDSLFAWRLTDQEHHEVHEDSKVRYGLFAEHPADFARSSKIVPVRRRSFPHVVTGRGVELFAPADLCSTMLESCWLGQYILREMDLSTRVRLACRDMSSSTTEKHSITLKIKKDLSPLPTDARLLYRRIDADETLLTNYARFHSILILAFGRRGFYIAPTKTFERANYRLHDCPQAILLRLLSLLYTISLAGISTYATSDRGQEHHMSIGMSWAILTFGLLMSHWKMTYTASVLIMATISGEAPWTLDGVAIKVLQDVQRLGTSLTPGIAAVGAVTLAVGYWLTAVSPMP
ncbi:Vegetative incompatibility protein HET-E-1 [Pseudocercospora fuligena]|uniref:Vegetative incompatibility protein HET-E-1 n=1 Tax=Pseudocercospora fuligena TaxID=685502 RepID=A0A8H6R463_9PEZI|nr:Vegetative incompatibility protein HET-E-1 [Pseudocercospora fuligena]